MVNAFEVAKKFHEVYERLAPSFGYETRTETRAFNPDSPNGKLMIAVCQGVGDQIRASAFHAGRESGMIETRREWDRITNILSARRVPRMMTSQARPSLRRALVSGATNESMSIPGMS